MDTECAGRNETRRLPPQAQQLGWTEPAAQMRVRLTRKFSALIDGIDLSRVHEGDTIDLSPREALTLIAEGWALPVHDTGYRPERDKAHDRPRRTSKKPQKD
jgi:hypothetical protein